MNWVFETYSNVYNTAMMQDSKSARSIAPIKLAKKTGLVARLFGRA